MTCLVKRPYPIVLIPGGDQVVLGGAGDVEIPVAIEVGDGEQMGAGDFGVDIVGRPIRGFEPDDPFAMAPRGHKIDLLVAVNVGRPDVRRAPSCPWRLCVS